MRDNELSFFVDFGIMQESAAASVDTTNSVTPTEPVSLKSRFDQALALQQQKNWDSALDNYKAALDQSPAELSVSQAAVIYYNMSTIAYERGDFLNAYIWARKSVSLDSSNAVARESLQHYTTQFQTPSVPRQISNYDNFKSGLSLASLDLLIPLCAILVLVTIGTALKNSLTNRKNRMAGIFTPRPRWPVFLLVTISAVVISLTWLRYEDSRIPRALVLSTTAPVQTAPGENMTVIFEAPAGLELEVLKENQGYVQVRHPGAFVGWMKRSDIELLSLSFEQK